MREGGNHFVHSRSWCDDAYSVRRRGGGAVENYREGEAGFAVEAVEVVASQHQLEGVVAEELVRGIDVDGVADEPSGTRAGDAERAAGGHQVVRAAVGYELVPGALVTGPSAGEAVTWPVPGHTPHGILRLPWQAEQRRLTVSPSSVVRELKPSP